MKVKTTYDKYYKTVNFFGEPYPELTDYFAQYPERGKVLDLGCGQGRDAIVLARLGYSVIGIDHSQVGVDQMSQIAKAENLDLTGVVGDIYSFDKFDAFDIILLDSMLHFAKKDEAKEIGFVKKIVNEIKNGCMLVVCIQDVRNKVSTLHRAIGFEPRTHLLTERKFQYSFKDHDSGHQIVTDYRMIVITK